MSLHIVHSIPEKELHRLRQQLLDGAKDPMVVVRGEGVLLCNEPARALLRWPSVEMVGVQVRALFSSSSLTKLRKGWDEAQKASAPVQVRDVSVMRNDGEEQPADVLLVPLSWYDDPTTLLHFRAVLEPDSTIKALKASENRFRSFIENVSDGIFQSTREGKLLLVNPAFARMFGYESIEEALELNVGRDIYADPAEREALLKDVEAADVKENVELRLRRKDGSEIVCLTNTRAVRRSSGEVWFYEGTLKDVTPWKRMQEQLRESQERYRAFITQSTEGIWCFELEEPMPVSLPPEEQVERLINRSYLKECNGRMAQMLGHNRPEEILGARMGDLFDMGETTGKAILREYVRNGYRLENRETYFPGPAGAPGVHVSSNVVGIVERDHLLRAWGTQQDITARKRAENELRDAQKMETLGTLAGGVAHDFNNILTVIRGYVDRLERESLVLPEGKQSVHAIDTAIRRGAGIVRQLMTFAREEQGTMSRVQVSTLLAEVADLLRVTLMEKTELVTSVEDSIPDLYGDEAQLHQALLNLAMNARDAMPDGGSIIMTAKAVDGEALRETYPDADRDLYVCLSVADEGAGIPGKVRERLFEPFYTTKDIGKGTGLGLAVVYGVVRGHGGYVEVKPNDARGSVFHLYLPGQEAVDESPPAAQPAPALPTGDETVLIVEDEEMLLDLLKYLLQANGYTVLTATDGVEAVEVYERHKDSIAIVLSDMGLPRQGGYEAFMKMKEINPGVRSILASGYMDPTMREKLLQAGAMEFLQKPYVPEIILRSIREFIDKT